MTSRRWLAWACVLLVLVAIATPATAGPPAILVPAGPAFVQPTALGLVRATSHAPPPDPFGSVAVPARAPPLT